MHFVCWYIPIGLDKIRYPGRVIFVTPLELNLFEIVPNKMCLMIIDFLILQLWHDHYSYLNVNVGYSLFPLKFCLVKLY